MEAYTFFFRELVLVDIIVENTMRILRYCYQQFIPAMCWKNLEKRYGLLNSNIACVVTENMEVNILGRMEGT